MVLRERLADAGLADDVEVASAGTSDEEHGRPIDPVPARSSLSTATPSRATAPTRWCPASLGRYDLALAMTSQHARALRRRADEDGGGAEIRLWREFDDTAPRLGDGATERDLDVPDPWYGDQDGFYDTLAVVERGADGLVRYLQERLGPG